MLGGISNDTSRRSDYGKIQDRNHLVGALRFPEEEVDQRYETTLVKAFSGPYLVSFMTAAGQVEIMACGPCEG
jgi:hypothetical protein